MTAYAASVSVGAVSALVTISPSSSFQVRIAKIECCASNVQLNQFGTVINVGFGLTVYPSGTLSGGTTVAPVPMQSGSPSATATVKSGGSISGTGFNLHNESNYTPNNYQDANSTATTNVAQLNSSYVPAFDLIVANGSLFSAGGSSSPAASLTVVVYFEELRTARTL